jgi:serine/threonine protein kinase
MELVPGTAIDRYVVEGVLGTGGMATVYLVRHETLNTLHALKVLDVASADVRRRLIEEGRAQSRLRHPNIVPVTDVVPVRGAPGLVMDYVEGPSLRQFLSDHRCTIPELDALAGGILDGVEAAHAAGLVHRDLKPDNVLVHVVDGRVVPRITDFGLAKFLDRELAEHATRTGTTMGTPAYMPPEQIRDASSVDARADVWAIGTILYELVTGQMAFPAEDTFALYDNIQQGEYARADTLRPDIPNRMRDAIEGALVPDRNRRFSTVEELAAVWGKDTDAAPTLWSVPALSHASTPAPLRRNTVTPNTFVVSGTSTFPAEPPDKRRKRRYLAPTLVLGLVICAVAIGTAIWSQSEPGVPEAPPTIALLSNTQRAVEAIRTGNPNQAEQFAQIAVQRDASDTEATLALWVSQRILGTTTTANANMQQAAQNVPMDETVNAQLIRLITAPPGDRGFKSEGLRTLRMEHPNQRWPRHVFLQLIPNRDIELLTNMVAEDPTDATVRYYAATRLANGGHHALGKEILNEGLNRYPTSPLLLYGVALAAGHAGDLETMSSRARDAVRAGQEVAAARFLLIRAALAQQDEEAHQHHRAIVLDELRVPEIRGISAAELGWIYHGFGRSKEGWEALDLCDQITTDNDLPGARFDCLRAGFRLSLIFGLDERATDYLRRMEVLSADLSNIPNMRAAIKLGQIRLHIRNGEADLAELELGKLSPEAAVSATLQQAIDATRGTIPADNGRLQGCITPFWLARDAEVAGDPNADQKYESFLAKCKSVLGQPSLYRGDAVHRLARLRGESVEKAMRSHWPTIDDDHVWLTTDK